MIDPQTDLISLTEMQISPRPIFDDVTVLIPTLGRDILEKCLQSIAVGSAWPAELIVVDQSSNPLVASWLDALQSWGLNTRYMPSNRRGKSAGLNDGLAKVDTRFVVVTDDDCLVELDWLEKMSCRLEISPTAIITGRVEPEGGKEVLSTITSMTPKTYDRPPLKLDPLYGGNMGVAKEIISQIGLFDEDPCLYAAEDCEWSYRALRSEVSMHYAPEVAVKHIGWRDANQHAERHRAYTRSLGAFYGKYIRQGDLFIAARTTMTFLRGLRRWVWGYLGDDPERVISGYAVLTELIPGILAGIRSGR